MIGAVAILGLPAVVLLRDLGPLPGDALEHTVWKKGMRIVNDVAGTPLKPADIELGQLVNAEPAAFFPQEGPNGKVIPARYEGTELNNEKAKAAVILVRMQAEDIHPIKSQSRLGLQRDPVLLEDLHPRRLPDQPVGARDPPPAVPVPPVDLRPGAQRRGHLRPGGPVAAAAADRARLPRAT